ncbi:uncharacterized protein LOC124119056 [Haliotis rufescens]|uniref:uncharacterized protein LOC124119056 n=1 Tax=Haliotis rufescens TaxID=6454 RepID=UPI001EB0144E|nr:uncharacterized protein LOC124119056 [Haliotis rufescens]
MDRLLILFFLGCVRGQLPSAEPCQDKLPNCAAYGQASCTSYTDWAKENCNSYCKFCTANIPCEDKSNDCANYDTATCNNPQFSHWADTQCRYFCRRCSAAALAAKDALQTTLPPSMCKDKIDCRPYKQDSCTQYPGWAKDNCMAFCGICKGAPTPPHVCADAIPGCAAYDKEKTCKDSKFTLWVQDNCAKYCGLCNDGTVTSGPGPLIPTGPIMTSGPGPIKTGSGLLTPPGIAGFSPAPIAGK